MLSSAAQLRHQLTVLGWRLLGMHPGPWAGVAPEVEWLASTAAAARSDQHVMSYVGASYLHTWSLVSARSMLALLTARSLPLATLTASGHI
jgi:hypothetical protein